MAVALLMVLVGIHPFIFAVHSLTRVDISKVINMVRLSSFHLKSQFCFCLSIHAMLRKAWNAAPSRLESCHHGLA